MSRPSVARVAPKPKPSEQVDRTVAVITAMLRRGSGRFRGNILDRELTELARRAIRVAFDDRQEQLRRDVGIIQNDMSARGLGRSGPLADALTQRGEEEVRTCGRLVVAEFRTILEETQAPYADGMAESLKAETGAMLLDRTIAVDGLIVGKIQAAVPDLVAYARDKLHRARTRAQEEADVDIDRLVLVTRRRTARTGVPAADDVIRELRLSGLAETDSIIAKLATSAEATQEPRVNLNTCLTDARIALQTLAEAVARSVTAPTPVSAPGFGPALTHLRVAGYISERTEEAIAGMAAITSEGAHKPLIGLTEIEMAALGRRLAVAACYFLIKLHNATRGERPTTEESPREGSA